MPLETDSIDLEQLQSEDAVIQEVQTDAQNTQIFLVLPTGSDTESVGDPQEDRLEDLSLSSDLYDVKVTKQTITAADASGIKSTLLSLVGDYETVVTDYTYTTYNGSVQHSIDVQPDYAWILSLAVFALCLYSCFRMFGMAMKGGKRW